MRRLVAAREPAQAFAERYRDLGGQSFVNDVVRLAHTLPRSNPNDDSWLAHWRSVAAEGSEDPKVAVEIDRLQRQIERARVTEARRTAILSALASGNREQLKEALTGVHGADAVRAQL